MRLGAAGVVFGAAAAAAVLVALSPMAHATHMDTCTVTSTVTCPTPTPTPPPSPTPIPVNATIGLNPTAGGPAIGITVTGQLFLPGESITLYWDDPSRVAGSAQADSSGGFKVVVKAFPGDAPGVHHLYANVPPTPHADFTLESPSSPTPPASPTPSESPSASASQSRTESPSPTFSPASPGGISGFDIITRPPFVFLPIIGALGLLGVIGYWALTGTRRNRTSALPASVVHRSFRPDYGAPIGGAVAPAATASVAEAPPAVEPPAPPSTEPLATEAAPPAESFEPPVADAPPPAPHEIPGAPDAPPDLPEPSD